MMRGLIKRGAAEDLANAGAGYVANGESEFSRQAARSGRTREFDGDGPPRLKRVKQSRAGLIARATKQIAKLKGDISLSSSEVRCALLRERLQHQEDLLARLQAERNR